MTGSAQLLKQLEESAMAGDSTSRLVLEHPITGFLLKELIESPVPTYIRFDVPCTSLILKDGKRRLIAGYASVEVIDKQNELVTISALRNAWDRLQAAGEKYANINLEHSNITLGKILLKGTVEDSAGQKYWSHVDDKGLFVVAELRDDIEIADKVWQMANQHELNAFSIGGRALKKGLAKEGNRTFWKIDDLELYEITICKRGKNTESGFEVLKSYLAHGLIDQDMFLQKSQELKKSEQLVKELSFLPSLMGKNLIIRENFVCEVGSAVEKGEGHDFDLLIKMDPDNPIRRHIETRLFKAVPPDLWDKLEFIYGDEGGPHDTFRPLFDLALVPSGSLARVEMAKADSTSDPSSGQSSGTLKNIVGVEPSEDHKMDPTEKKAVGTPELTGTSTGPQSGGVSGTSTEGPEIARLRAKVKEAEAALKAETEKKPIAELKPEEKKPPFPEKEAECKPEEKNPEDKEAGKKYPLPEEKEGEDKTKKPYPPEAEEDEKAASDDMDPELFKILLDYEAKGKVPEGLKRFIAERKKKMAKSDPEVAALRKSVEALTTQVSTLVKSLDPNTLAKVAADILKAESHAIKKSAYVPGVNPDATLQNAGKPLSLHDLHGMTWSAVEAESERRRAAALGGN